MIKYIALCLCVCLSGVLCEYLNRKEGDQCEWEGLKGTCVKETRCLSTLDDDSPKHPVCSHTLGEKIICCTDCKLVNSTKNAVFVPPHGLFWKNGRKARDNCLQYLQDLPYQCKEDKFHAGISREFDEDNQCYEYSEWQVGISSSEDKTPRAEFPHRVLLGWSFEWQTKWESGGFIISDRYIVTYARAQRHAWGPLLFVAVGVSNHWDSSFWKTHSVKRFIPHPQFNLNKPFNDIALIETETPIKFNENVLPACLHVEEDASTKEAIAIVRELEDCLEPEITLKERAQTEQGSINFLKLSQDDCNLTLVIDSQYYQKIHMCYGTKVVKPHLQCRFVERDPLLITTQFSSCVHTAIGFPTLISDCEFGFCQLFVNISYYVPWIESIVWPDEA